LTIKTKNFERWLAALESDEFDQATGALVDTAAWWEDRDVGDAEMFHSLYGSRVEPLGFCCLGVAECVRRGNPDKLDDWADNGLASRQLLHWLGIPVLENQRGRVPALAKDDGQYDIVVVDKSGRRTHAKTTSQRNDGGQSFAEIALWLSENRDRLRGERDET